VTGGTDVASGLNKVMVLGNLGGDPTMRYTAGGKAVTTFSVAVGRRIGTGDTQREETEWFHMVAYEKLAETTNQYLTKGAKVYVEGRLQTRSWEDQEGQKHSRTEVIAQQVLFLDPARRAGEAAPAGEASDLSAEDLPF
jgi:single-strand DNA-binding protein